MYAVGVSDQLTAPVFSQLYRAVWMGLVRPHCRRVGAIALVLPRRSYLICVICYVNFLVLFTTLWLMFALDAFYLSEPNILGVAEGSGWPQFVR